ncbi:MAG: PAS domain-containing protein [Acidobacteria bacterium]|nr:PAS domain-containing protein [Acidobacteriota bacterium]
MNQQRQGSEPIDPAPLLARRLGVALLVWLGSAAVIFAGYELIERFWLWRYSLGVRNLAQMGRDLTIALVSTALAAFYLFGRVLPSLARGLEAPARREGGAVAVREALAGWLLGLRWVAVLVSVAVVAFATWYGPRVESSSAPYLWAGVALLFVFNTVLSVYGTRLFGSQSALVGQVAVDVAILAWLVHHAGGLSNPFAGFFVFHATIAAVVLDPPWPRRAAVGIALFVLALGVAEVTGVFPPRCLLDGGGVCAAPPADWMLQAATGTAIAVTVVVCGLIVASLVRVLHADRERLAAARSQVLEEREKLQTIIDCMSDAVVYVRSNGTVELRNRAAQRFWPEPMPSNGELQAAGLPEPWRDLLNTLSVPEPAEVHPVFQAHGRSYEGSYARVDDARGELQGVVMETRDVTERLETQRWRMQEERMAVVGKLAAALAHELNNPLGAIALFAQHALDGVRPGDPLHEHLGTVLRNAKLCKKIVRDLLEYARQRPPERREVLLAEIVADAERTLTPQAEDSRVKLQREGVNGFGARVHGDPDQLRQVLVNLGLNAIEAMPEGGTLTFRLDRTEEGRLRIDVADTGVGIAPEEQERIFTAFHTTKAEGTGLGLTVARDLVAAHGGVLAVESVPGRGSTFTVSLPAFDASDASADVTEVSSS